MVADAERLKKTGLEGFFLGGFSGSGNFEARDIKLGTLTGLNEAFTMLCKMLTQLHVHVRTHVMCT